MKFKWSLGDGNVWNNLKPLAGIWCCLMLVWCYFAALWCYLMLFVGTTARIFRRLKGWTHLWNGHGTTGFAAVFNLVSPFILFLEIITVFGVIHPFFLTNLERSQLPTNPTDQKKMHTRRLRRDGVVLLNALLDVLRQCWGQRHCWVHFDMPQLSTKRQDLSTGEHHLIFILASIFCVCLFFSTKKSDHETCMKP